MRLWTWQNVTEQVVPPPPPPLANMSANQGVREKRDGALADSWDRGSVRVERGDGGGGGQMEGGACV